MNIMISSLCKRRYQFLHIRQSVIVIDYNRDILDINSFVSDKSKPDMTPDYTQTTYYCFNKVL